MGCQPHRGAMFAQRSVVFPTDINNSVHHRTFCLIRRPTFTHSGTWVIFLCQRSYLSKRDFVLGEVDRPILSTYATFSQANCPAATHTYRQKPMLWVCIFEYVWWGPLLFILVPVICAQCRQQRLQSTTTCYVLMWILMKHVKIQST